MALLEVTGLEKAFGGVTAIAGLHFEVPEGVVYSVIGPNGAGKTTLFNMLSGIYRPDDGDVSFSDHDIVGLRPHRVAALGIFRTFQNLQVFNMTVLENVMVGCHLRTRSGLLGSILRLPGVLKEERGVRRWSREALEFCGLSDLIGRHAGELPYGALKRLESARALTAQPRMLLMDELAAGLNDTETLDMRALIRRICEAGITVLLVEHNMGLVMQVSDRILVLDYGSRLAEGTPEAVRSDPKVTSQPISVVRCTMRSNEPSPNQPLLAVSGLCSFYGPVQALHAVDLEVRAGELVAIVGANGAGKTTLRLTLSGVQRPSGGSVHFDGNEITRQAPHRIVGAGVCQVPEGRQMFAPLSVEDNLRLGAYSQRKDRDWVEQEMARIYALFPILRERAGQMAGTLSGGQQQMLAIGRAMLGRPRLLLLDEPSMGLAPLLVEEIFRVVRALNDQGVTILLVEQNARAALAIADRGYVLETGRVVMSAPADELLQDEAVQRAYLADVPPSNKHTTPYNYMN